VGYGVSGVRCEVSGFRYILEASKIIPAVLAVNGTGFSAPF